MTEELNLNPEDNLMIAWWLWARRVTLPLKKTGTGDASSGILDAIPAGYIFWKPSTWRRNCEEMPRKIAWTGRISGKQRMRELMISLHKYLGEAQGEMTDYPTWRTVWHKTPEYELAISRQSPEIWGKFLVIRGMKKQVSLTGGWQHKNVSDPRHEAQLDPEAAVPHGCLKWPRATRPRGWRAPLPPPCPAPVLRAATEGVPARWGVPGLWSYTSRCLTGCTDDEADLWTAVSQPLRKVAPFSHNAFKTQHSPLFLLLPQALLNICQFSKAALYFDLQR